RDLRRRPAPHRGRALDLRGRGQRRGRPVLRPAREAAEVLAVRRVRRGRGPGRLRLHVPLRVRPRRQRHRPRAVGRGLRAARRRLDLRRPRQPARRHRRRVPAGDAAQRAGAQQRVIGRADRRHRRPAAVLCPRPGRLGAGARGSARAPPRVHHRPITIPVRRDMSISKFALVPVLALAVAACGSTKESTEKSDSGAASSSTKSTPKNASGKLTIAFLPKQINNPYFTVSDNGGKQAVEGLGDTFKRVGPSEGTASSQVSYINTLTTQKVSAIAISANDPNAVVPALKKAMSAGIKVVTYDSDTAPDGRNLFINQAN